MKFLAAGLFALLSLAIVMNTNLAGEKPKYTISQVMKTAHVGDDESLLAKVADGSADAKEKKQLVELYKALSQNKPPKGDEKSWKMLTGGLIKAAEAAAGGGEDAGKALIKAANCTGCHSKHRPVKKE